MALAALLVVACSSTSHPTTEATLPIGPASTAINAPTSTTATSGAGSGHWVPALDTSWQWELDHPLNLTTPRDMGTGLRDYLGHAAADPTMYDIDGFDNPASTVAALHSRGDHAVCYMEVGAIESYRPDVDAFPHRVVGRVVDGYPDEHYLDIRSPVVLRLIETRITMCAAKGFDAVEPDIDDSYTDNTGFPISQADEVSYDRTLAAFTHLQGLSITLKNGDAPTFAAALEPYVDFVIDEQCFQYSTCDAFSPYVQAGKAVFEVEYHGSTSGFCPDANRRNFNAQKFDVLLDGPRHPCR